MKKNIAIISLIRIYAKILNPGRHANFISATLSLIKKILKQVQDDILPKYYYLLLSILLFIVTVYGAKTLIEKNVLLVDEKDSYSQIALFTKGLTLDPEISSVRGYHLFVAVISRLFQNSSTAFLRYLVLGINLMAVPIFYLCARKIDPAKSLTKLFQFAYLPILFPFLYLIYNDVFSLTLVVLSVYFAVRGKYHLAYLTASASLAVKQNNIIWLLFIFCLIYLQENGWSLKWNLIKKHLRGSFIFGLGLSLFILFLVINKGLVMGQKNMHPVAISNMGNFYFLLFVFFFLFLPENLANFARIIRLLSGKKTILIFLALGLIVFFFGFQNSHPFNQSLFFLRNRILVTASSDPFTKICYYFIAAYSLLSIAVTSLKNRIYSFLYPATFISLIPLNLIEQRYYLIPFALYILFKKEEKQNITVVTIILNVIMSLVFTKLILTGNFFL